MLSVSTGVRISGKHESRDEGSGGAVGSRVGGGRGARVHTRVWKVKQRVRMKATGGGHTAGFYRLPGRALGAEENARGR